MGLIAPSTRLWADLSAQPPWRPLRVSTNHTSQRTVLNLLSTASITVRLSPEEHFPKQPPGPRPPPPQLNRTKENREAQRHSDCFSRDRPTQSLHRRRTSGAASGQISTAAGKASTNTRLIVPASSSSNLRPDTYPTGPKRSNELGTSGDDRPAKRSRSSANTSFTRSELIDLTVDSDDEDAGDSANRVNVTNCTSDHNANDRDDDDIVIISVSSPDKHPVNSLPGNNSPVNKLPVHNSPLHDPPVNIPSVNSLPVVTSVENITKALDAWESYRPPDIVDGEGSNVARNETLSGFSTLVEHDGAVSAVQPRISPSYAPTTRSDSRPSDSDTLVNDEINNVAESKSPLQSTNHTVTPVAPAQFKSSTRSSHTTANSTGGGKHQSLLSEHNPRPFTRADLKKLSCPKPVTTASTKTPSVQRAMSQTSLPTVNASDATSRTATPPDVRRIATPTSRQDSASNPPSFKTRVSSFQSSSTQKNHRPLAHISHPIVPAPISVAIKDASSNIRQTSTPTLTQATGHSESSAPINKVTSAQASLPQSTSSIRQPPSQASKVSHLSHPPAIKAKVTTKVNSAHTSLQQSPSSTRHTDPPVSLQAFPSVVSPTARQDNPDSVKSTKDTGILLDRQTATLVAPQPVSGASSSTFPRTSSRTDTSKSNMSTSLDRRRSIPSPSQVAPTARGLKASESNADEVVTLKRAMTNFPAISPFQTTSHAHLVFDSQRKVDSGKTVDTRIPNRSDHPASPTKQARAIRTEQPTSSTSTISSRPQLTSASETTARAPIFTPNSQAGSSPLTAGTTLKDADEKRRLLRSLSPEIPLQVVQRVETMNQTSVLPSLPQRSAPATAPRQRAPLISTSSTSTVVESVKEATQKQEVSKPSAEAEPATSSTSKTAYKRTPSGQQKSKMVSTMPKQPGAAVDRGAISPNLISNSILQQIERLRGRHATSHKTPEPDTSGKSRASKTAANQELPNTKTTPKTQRENGPFGITGRALDQPELSLDALPLTNVSVRAPRPATVLTDGFRTSNATTLTRDDAWTIPEAVIDDFARADASMESLLVVRDLLTKDLPSARDECLRAMMARIRRLSYQVETRGRKPLSEKVVVEQANILVAKTMTLRRRLAARLTSSTSQSAQSPASSPLPQSLAVKRNTQSTTVAEGVMALAKSAPLAPDPPPPTSTVKKSQMSEFTESAPTPTPNTRSGTSVSFSNTISKTITVEKSSNSASSSCHLTAKDFDPRLGQLSLSHDSGPPSPHSAEAEVEPPSLDKWILTRKLPRITGCREFRSKMDRIEQPTKQYRPNPPSQDRVDRRYLAKWKGKDGQPSQHWVGLPISFGSHADTRL